MNTTVFPLPKKRVPTTGEWGAIEKFCNANRPQDGIDILVGDSPAGGMAINAGDTGGLPSQLFRNPFRLVNNSDPDGFFIRVVYGTVNGVAPDGMSPGDVPPFVLEALDETGFVYLAISTDGAPLYSITSRTIGIDETIPSDTATDFYLEIGSYAVVDDTTLFLAQAISGSQSFAWCDGPKFALS